MKRIALLLAPCLALVLSVPSAHADEASRHAKAKEMLTLMHMDTTMSKMMDNMMQQMSAMSKQMGGGNGNVTPDQQARLDEFQKKVFALIETQMSWQNLEPDYIDLYAKNFTDEQLDGIITFYKSPAGIAMIDKLPTLTNEGMQLAQTRMTAIQPQLMQMIQDFAKSAAPAGAPMLKVPPPPPPPPPAKSTPQ
jgi:uncharacterized protein